MTLTADRLRSLFNYDPSTGLFVRLVRTGPRTKVGDVAGGLDAYGYVIVRVDAKSHKAHRLAWLYMTGEWPSREIDHLDGEPANNRFANLREADRTINNENHRRARRTSRTGLLGVQIDRSRFKAAICVGARRVHLGMFDTAEAAHSAYVAAKRTLHEGNTL